MRTKRDNGQRNGPRIQEEPRETQGETAESAQLSIQRSLGDKRGQQEAKGDKRRTILTPHPEEP